MLGGELGGELGADPTSSRCSTVSRTPSAKVTYVGEDDVDGRVARRTTDGRDRPRPKLVDRPAGAREPARRRQHADASTSGSTARTASARCDFDCPKQVGHGRAEPSPTGAPTSRSRRRRRRGHRDDPDLGLDVAGRHRSTDRTRLAAALLPRMPFMVVGTGPLGIGMLERLASRALSRWRTSVISAGLTWRPSFWTCVTSLGSGTSPSPLPQTTSWIGISAATRSCLRRSRGQQLAQPVGVALADQDDAGRADDAVHDVLLLGEGDRPGRSSSRGASIRSAAAAAPGWPSIWLYAAFWARRPKTISASERAEQQRADDRDDPADQPVAGQQPEDARSRRPRRAGTTPAGSEADPRVGLAWSSGRSR